MSFRLSLVTRHILAIAFCAFSVLVHAAELVSLPEPLTLEAALQFASKSDHYQLQSADQKLQQALAEAGQSASLNDITVNVSGRLRKAGVSDLGGVVNDNDSVISLFVRKPLYDFGKSSVRESLAQLNSQLKQLEIDFLIEQRLLSITQKYFDVLNADNEFLRHNEELAIGYIRFDRARENKELGLTSELDVLERQVTYETIRQNRYNSENMQRLTRIILAEELGFPDTPPSEISEPEMIADGKINDDVDKLVEQAFKHSLRLKIQQKKHDIAKKAIELARHTSGPQLDAELELSDYAREGSTRDDWRASIYFNIPIYAGSVEKTAINVATAKYRQVLSDLHKARSEIRILVLQLWQAIRQNELRLGGEIINQDFRDMTLDRSRAEYELEFNTDLGDSMVQFSDSRMKAYQARYALEMAWRKLQKLVGEEYLDKIKLSTINNG
ncbi:MAG: TolC family protein [Gammaproteobacteria bacterium]|jgi:outer membrane protein TolC|nr:TolC family protein [Gammaproteobacteria bacterium]MBT3723339.1 TolC family protein [Gammaproteobacteria bacterium]MBT4078786.1 TolC family protein [Gammaproteobacteria bacterium]MBT4194518.1 TolC family protein [Gammaproteobacteria bacterium]MBT4449755.1 TolC family protein [Gammaproteobacteria bacterium]